MADDQPVGVVPQQDDNAKILTEEVVSRASASPEDQISLPPNPASSGVAGTPMSAQQNVVPPPAKPPLTPPRMDPLTKSPNSVVSSEHPETSNQSQNMAVSPIDQMYKPRPLQENVASNPVQDTPPAARFNLSPAPAPSAPEPFHGSMLPAAPIPPATIPISSAVAPTPPSIQSPPHVPPTPAAPTPQPTIQSTPAHQPFAMPPHEAPAATPANSTTPPPPPAPPVQAAVPSHTPRRAKKTIKTVLAIIILLIVFGVGGVAASYRFAPQFFFNVMPASASRYINALWPLHSSFAEMLPQSTALYGSATFSPESEQAKQLLTVLKRIPGLDASNTSLSQGLESALKSSLGLSFSNDIKPVFGETIYFAAPKASGTIPALTFAVPIKDLKKAEAIFTKLQVGSGTSGLVTKSQVYNGVQIYSIKSSVPTVPTNTKSIQSFKTLFSPSVAKAAPILPPCIGLLQACADEVPIQSTASHLVFASMDRFLILADSEDTLQAIISQNHSRSASLVTQASYARLQTSPTNSLFSLFVNPQAVRDEASIKGLGPLYNGLTGTEYNFSADTNGFKLGSNTYYDSTKLDPKLAKVVGEADRTYPYASALPDSTAMMFEGNALGSELGLLGGVALDKDTTLDQTVKAIVGVSLTDLGTHLTGPYVISYQPASKSALVLQADATDSEALKTLISTVASHIASTYTGSVSVKNETIQNADSTVISFNDESIGMNGYFEPTIVIANSQLIISSNKSGATSALSPATTSLAADPRFIADGKIVGTPARTLWYLNTKRFYNGVIDAIRVITENPDLTESTQEKVLDAYLDVFPSLSAATHTGRDVATSIGIIPVVDLGSARRAEIDALLKDQSAQIFNIAPFLSPFSSNSVTPSTAATHDVKRQNDLEDIVLAVVHANSGNANLSKYKTSGDEKLDSTSGVMKQMVESQDIRADTLDPDWPDFYYTMNNDGQTVRVSALTVDKFTKADGNCADPTQIRGRWTYCVSQKAQ